ncbi:MAG: SUMF1/EgtB/PvdO family nonheme iron enzyme, partial [Chitinispirillia bacterium]|nr:SUMF1/EgtB/PvdO family nonheme iron enzyme [Chitinispirillia bacterium]
MSISVHSRLVSGKARKHPRLLTAMVFPALLLVSAFAAGSPVQAEIAYVPVRVVASSGATATVTFTPPSVGNLSGATKEITVGVDTTFVFNLGGDTRISHRVQRTNGAAAASFRRGNISLMLPSELYKNAAVSLYAINGRRVFNSKVASTSSTAGSLNRPLNNIPAGVYLLSVKSDNGNSFSSRLSHSGGKLNLNVAFTGGAFSFDKLAKQTAANNEWTISATSASFSSQAPSSKVLITGGNNPTIYIKFANSNFGMGGSTIEVSPSRLPDVETVPPKALPNPAASYTETAGGQSFDMVYISGGTFTLGCSGSGCPPDTRAVEDVTVSPYYIAKTTVNSNLWNAVMGGGASSFMGPQITWYDAMVFACRLSKMTGRNYRMQTEAEFEYAVKKHKSSLTISASTEEWAYNSWSGTHSGGTDPVGPGSGQHTQKTRRNATGYADTVGRLIRSIEGIGPALRLVISANGSFPTEYVAPCNIHAPEMDREPVNSYRDMRWVTGGDSAWAAVTGG